MREKLYSCTSPCDPEEDGVVRVSHRCRRLEEAIEEEEEEQRIPNCSNLEACCVTRGRVLRVKEKKT